MITPPRPGSDLSIDQLECEIDRLLASSDRMLSMADGLAKLLEERRQAGASDREIGRNNSLAICA